MQIDNVDTTQLADVVSEQPVYRRAASGGEGFRILEIFATEIVRSEIGRIWSTWRSAPFESLKVTLLGRGEFTFILLEEHAYWDENLGGQFESKLIPVVIRSSTRG